MGGSDFWHSDLSYLPLPAYCTLLYALEIPKETSRGNTQFINMQRAYDTLPEKSKKFYATLSAVHNIGHNNGFPIDKYEANESPTPDDATHPLIRVHPVNGRKVVYANPAYTFRVVEAETNNELANSDEILEELFDHCISANYVFEHEWNVGDLLIWDNVSLIHRATTIDLEDGLRREMLRCCCICQDSPIAANK